MEHKKECLCYKCEFYEDCKKALNAVKTLNITYKTLDVKNNVCPIVEVLNKFGDAALLQVTINFFKELGFFKGIRKVMFGK